MASTVKKPTSKYTPEMEARMRESQPLNAAVCASLAAEFGGEITAKGVIAKASRMELTYVRKAPVTKNGGRVEQKETIVSEISDLLDVSLAGLEDAPKAVLQRLRDAIAG